MTAAWRVPTADAVAVLDAAGVDRAAWIGWSMGVQVGLEAVRRAPDRVAALVALLGTYGQPFRTAFPGKVGHLVEGVFAASLHAPWVAQAALDLAVGLPTIAFHLLSTFAFIGADVDRTIFDGNVRSVATAERRTYLRQLLELARHDAADVLPAVRCPTLVVCGARDWLTPPKVARRMADGIPGAIYHEIPRATHFGLIEQTEHVNRLLGDFLASAFVRRAVAGASP